MFHIPYSMKDRGFTLLELLVVLSLIVLFSALILPNYKKGEYLFALQRSQYKLTQDTERAREFAISAKEFAGEIPKGGWGIYLTPTTSTYILFADCDEDGEYDKENLPCGGYSEKTEEISLEKGVEISELSPIRDSSLTIIFKGPIPDVIINKDQFSAFITLTISGFSKIISVNKVGLIEIK